MKILSKTNKFYPKRLLNIHNPPSKLYVEGNYKLLNSNSIAIVGTRKCTEYGKKYSAKFAKELSQKGMCIVSGLAIGIDTIAHINSMEELGKTIAVIGSGFNHIYPEENEWLFHKIIENGGCVVSEYHPDEKKDMANFPERNRIISGLALGVLVVEAPYRGGSTITAKHARLQGKEVFCIPNRLDEPEGYSTNWLIQNGANLVMEPDDILQYYDLQPKITIPKEYEEIYNLINTQPISANEICKMTGKKISEIMQILFMLELDGYIKCVAGNKYIKKE